MNRLIRLGCVAILLAAPVLLTAQTYPTSCLGSAATIRGTGENDTIYGTNHRDVIDARAGDDSVHALAGDDRICGNSGADFISDGYGRDAIDGGYGFDTLYLCPDGASNSWVNIERVVTTGMGCR